MVAMPFLARRTTAPAAASASAASKRRHARAPRGADRSRYFGLGGAFGGLAVLALGAGGGLGALGGGFGATRVGLGLGGGLECRRDGGHRCLALGLGPRAAVDDDRAVGRLDVDGLGDGLGLDASRPTASASTVSATASASAGLFDLGLGRGRHDGDRCGGLGHDLLDPDGQALEGRRLGQVLGHRREPGRDRTRRRGARRSEPSRSRTTLTWPWTLSMACSMIAAWCSSCVSRSAFRRGDRAGRSLP